MFVRTVFDCDLHSTTYYCTRNQLTSNPTQDNNLEDKPASDINANSNTDVKLNDISGTC